MSDAPGFPLTDADHRAARVFVCVTVPLIALALATLVARIATKVRSSLHLRWDDYLLIIGLILAVADWAVLLDTIAYYVPLSRTSVTLVDVEYTIKLGVIAVPLCSISIACIKVGVAIQLLRFQQSQLWNICLYILIGIVVFTSIAFSLFDLLQCIPLAVTWDLTVLGARCVSSNTFRIVSNVQTGISISTDLILSLFPLTFLRKLRRPLTEKALICVLMAMGMTAGAASITKAVLLVKWVHDVDSSKIGFTISLLTCVEMFIGIVAACLPTLKPTFQKLLTSIGIDFTVETSHTFFDSYNTINTTTTEPVGRDPNVPKSNLSFLGDTTESSKTSGTLEKSRSVSVGHEELEEHSMKREMELASTSTV